MSQSIVATDLGCSGIFSDSVITQTFSWF